MSTPQPPRSDSDRKRLPVKPSEENLRKQAKRRAKADSIPLAEAQHRTAVEYGCRNWAELMHVVETMNRGVGQLANVRYEMEALPKAVNGDDEAAARALLAAGAFTQHDLDLALARAVLRFEQRQAMARLLIDHGADPDGQYGSDYGPIIFVTGECLDLGGLQFLIDAGADITAAPIDTKYGRQCILTYVLGTYARGRNAVRHAMIDLLLQRGAFVPDDLTPPVLAVHRGDAAALTALIAAHPQLPRQAFPKLNYGQHPLNGGTLLHLAAEFGERACVEVLLAGGAPIDARTEAGDSALFIACDGRPETDDRLAIIDRLATAGAHLNAACSAGRTALHAAAQHGPLLLVESLLRGGAREWIKDDAGRLPRDTAAAGTSADRDAIVDLLTLPNIKDPHFKAAVAAIHAGDLPSLKGLLADHPNLSRDIAKEPNCYPPGYFRNPKLLWFVANNPTLVPNLPTNITQLADAIIDAGVEQADLNYTLGLVMTSDPAVRQNLQRPLMETLLRRGAVATPHDILMTLGHGQTAPVLVLLEHGQPMTAPIAAGLGRLDELRRRLPAAMADEVHASLSMAVMNRQPEAARLCIAAGADVNAHVAVHSHAMPIHIAAGAGDLPMLKLLVNHNSRLTDRDTLWRGTPLGWAVHEKRPEAEAYLRTITNID